MLTTLEKVTFPDLKRAQCIALTTFRTTGQAVTTPVMFAQRGEIIYFGTRADAGKLKRLRSSTRVRLAPCSYGGKITGAVFEGRARILTTPEERTAATDALAKKYGLMLPLTRNAWRLLHWMPKVDEVYIAIEPGAD